MGQSQVDGANVSAAARAAVGLSSIGTSKRLPETFGQRIILPVHFDQDTDAPALTLAAYEWALVAVKPLAHTWHVITNAGPSCHNFNLPHTETPQKLLAES